MSDHHSEDDIFDFRRDNVVIDNDVANFTEEQCLQLAQDFQGNPREFGVANDWCLPTWDDFACWSAAPPGRILARSCRVVLQAELESVAEQQLTIQTGETEAFAFRLCTHVGWLQNTTNYNACIAALGDGEISGVPPSGAMAVATIVSAFSVTSLVFLAASAFIFTYFSSLRCSRTRVHLNLVVALMVNSLMLTIITLPIVVNHHYSSVEADNSEVSTDDSGSDNHNGPSEATRLIEYRLPNVRNVIENPKAVYLLLSEKRKEQGLVKETIIRRVPAACKLSLCIKLYSSMASVNWMFVEGIQLHSRITTSIFQQEAPFKFYYFIGWGFPLILIVTWGVKMQEILPHSTCWEGYRSYDVVWLLTGPKLVVLLINFVFLMNIIRILVTRVKCVTAENKQFRRAMKATVLLFPLLGTTHLLYGISPQDYDEKLSGFYMIVNAVLQSSQGMFVSVIHCFMNSEVQTSLRNAYLRALIRRNPNRRSFLSNNATHSQTSAIFLTQPCSLSRGPTGQLQAHSPAVRHSRFIRRQSSQHLQLDHLRQTSSAQHNNNCSIHLSHNSMSHHLRGSQIENDAHQHQMRRQYQQQRPQSQAQHTHRQLQRCQQRARGARSLSPYSKASSPESPVVCRCTSTSIVNLYRTSRSSGMRKLGIVSDQSSATVHIDCGISIDESVDL